MFNFELGDDEVWFIGVVLEGGLCGLYSGIFAMYLKYQGLKKDSDKKRNIIFCSICALYVLSITLFVVDITEPIYQFRNKLLDSALRNYLLDATLFGLCDFIAQFILIYRCWIVWGRNIRIVIIPSVLAFMFLVFWLGASSTYSPSGKPSATSTWGHWMTLLALTLSLSVNTLVTSLIVFRIFKVFREVRATTDHQILGTADGSKLRRIILVLIESGMALFTIQLIRLVITIVGIRIDAAYRALFIITSIHSMLNGITPTIILVRTSMGLSFNDEKSMEEIAIGSMRFASNHPNLVPETGGISTVGRDFREDDIGIRRSNDIDIVDKSIHR